MTQFRKKHILISLIHSYKHIEVRITLDLGGYQCNRTEYGRRVMIALGGIGALGGPAAVIYPAYSLQGAQPCSEFRIRLHNSEAHGVRSKVIRRFF